MADLVAGGHAGPAGFEFDCNCGGFIDDTHAFSIMVEFEEKKNQVKSKRNYFLQYIGRIL